MTHPITVAEKGDLRLSANRQCWPVQGQVEQASAPNVAGAWRAMAEKAATFEALGNDTYFCGAVPAAKGLRA